MPGEALLAFGADAPAGAALMLAAQPRAVIWARRRRGCSPGLRWLDVEGADACGLTGDCRHAHPRGWAWCRAINDRLQRAAAPRV